MSYQRFKKGGRVAKRQFLEKSVQNLKVKKLKRTFFKKKSDWMIHRGNQGGLATICLVSRKLWTYMEIFSQSHFFFFFASVSTFGRVALLYLDIHVYIKMLYV